MSRSEWATSAALQRLLARIEQARAGHERLSICGGDSKAFYAPASAAPPAACLSTRELQGIVSYDPSELVLTARAGTPLIEIEAELAAHGQCLGFEPPHFAGAGVSSARQATLGGMVAAGLSGPSRASVGALRDFVLGAELINGRAQLLRFGGQVMKNVAGYDVSRLLAGSLGALGVITEVSLKVLPQPMARATRVFEIGQAQALQLLAHWAGQPLPLQASCWMDGRLWLRLAGARAAVAAGVAALAERHGGEPMADEPACQFWAALREQQLAALQPDGDCAAVWRLALPPTAPVQDWPGACGEPVIEWHGAQRWLRAPLTVAAAWRQQARALGGHVTLFRAAPRAAQGGTASPAVFQPQEPVLARIQARLLAAFDPAGVFGGGRLAPCAAPEGGH
jgi:glycolate oxidase FAD binding subunit